VRVAKVQIAAMVEPEILRRVDADRATRRDEDGKRMSRSAVVQEALELWLEVAANEDRERATRVSDQIEATQDLVNAGVERLAKMVYRAQLAGEMSYQMFRAVSAKGAEMDREEMRGRAARQLDADRRRDVAGGWRRPAEPEETTPSFGPYSSE
jgi:Arc/MetJ-type ribon-helix-helix transcriptional regulator